MKIVGMTAALLILALSAPAWSETDLGFSEEKIQEAVEKSAEANVSAEQAIKTAVKETHGVAAVLGKVSDIERKEYRQQ